MMTRVLTAALFLPVILAVVVWAPPWAFAVMVAVVAVLGVLEVDGLARRSGWPLHRWISAGLAVGACAAFLDPPRAGERILLLSAGACIGGVALGVRRGGEGALACAAATLFAGFYPGVLLSFLVGVRGAGEPIGRRLILFFLIVIWLSDIAAYYLGRALGRRPLAPRISPKKTVEGALAGVAGAAGTAALLGYLLLPELGWTAPLLGAALGGVGIVGDLAESVLKRGAGVKDTSSLLPGHGGVLDRLDSMLLAAPLFSYYYLWAMR